MDGMDDSMHEQQESPEEREAELLTLLQDELTDAENYTDALIGPERAKALDYYLGRPMGDEREGRSKVISSEVYKVVEGLSTAIANIFATAKDAVEFVPRQADDVPKAEQRTAAVNYVFNSQNNGFLALVESVKDGVLSKAGFLSWRWEVERRVTQERYQNQTPESLQLLLQDNESVQLAGEPQITGMTPDGQPMLSVTVKVIKSKGRVVVESVPPEEVLVSSRARSPDLSKAPSVHWRSYKTRGELLKAGYDEATVDELSYGGRGSDTPVARIIDDGQFSETDEAEIITSWIEHDTDGDGIVELRRVVWCGTVVLENEITDAINLSAWTPNIQPHEFFGRCAADDAVEAQEVMTAIKRQTLDNLYFANNPMWRIDASDSRVHVEDFYNIEIGRPVRAPQGSADVVALPFVAQHSFPMLEFEQADTENKTGFTRYAQGLDAQSLNQTARGISIITNMSQQRVQLMARIYGEMCLKPAMRGIAKLLSQHGEEALAFRLDGKFVTVDPREWTEEFDMAVNVGLGVTDKDQQLMHLQTIAGAQAQAAASGLLGKLVTPKNLYNVQAKIAENAGFKDASFAWTNPDDIPEQPPAPPQPSDAQIKAEADMQTTQMQIQADGQKTQAQIEADAQKTQAQIEADIGIARVKAEIDAQAMIAKAQIDAQAKVQIAEITARQQANAEGAAQEASGNLQNMAVGQSQVLSDAMSILAASIERLNAPKRIVRDESGRAAGVEVVG